MKKTDSKPKQIEALTIDAGKEYGFDDKHDPSKPAQFWFQQSDEGLILFIVFYSLTCQWSRCTGCNLPSLMASHHVGFKSLMAQVDYVIADSSIAGRLATINKVIISNNGSILDERTYSSTTLMYLLAQLNLHMPNLKVLSLETRPEYVVAKFRGTDSRSEIHDGDSDGRFSIPPDSLPDEFNVGATLGVLARVME